MALQAKAQLDFSKGINAVTSPYLLAQQQVLRILNMILDEHGSLKTRDGTKIVDSAPNADALNPIVKLYTGTRVDGTVLKLALVFATPATKIYNRSTTPWTLLATITPRLTWALPDILMFRDKAVIQVGYSVDNVNGNLLSWDGTTLAKLTDSPGALHQIVHQGFLWTWNSDPQSGNTLDGPSSLRSSDVNNPNSWPAANQAWVARDDGQQGQGLGQFTIAEAGISPSAQIIAFKDFSAYQVTGVFGSSSFAIQKIKSDMGCVAPRSIQFLSGFGIVRLTHRGFALYDGVNDVLISEEIRPYISGRDDIAGIAWNTVQTSYASQAPNPPLYLCACPIDSTGLTRVFIYDLIRKAWSIANFAHPMSTMQLILVRGSVPVLWGGDFTGGKIRRMFAGDADDDGVPINWMTRLKPVFGSSPVQRAYYRRCVAKFYDVQAGQAISAQFAFGPSQAVHVKNRTVKMPVTAALSPLSGYGLDTYGTQPYGSSSLQAMLDIDVVFDLGVIADTALAEFTGTGSVRLRGIEWHVLPKPITVPVGVANGV